MQDTVTQDRELYIGGSDIPAVMGISPFTKRFDLLKYKVGNEENEFEGNANTEYGNVMESKIRDHINTLGWNFKEDKIILDDSDVLRTRYHADGTDHGARAVLEIKTTSQIHSNVEDYKVYLVQLLTGMWAFGYDNGVLAVYERPKDMSEEFDKDRLQIFLIGMEDYESLMHEILQATDDFRTDYRYLKENPWAEEDELPSRSKLTDATQGEVAIDGQVFPIAFLLKNEKSIKDALTDAKNQLKKQMKEHGIKSVEFADLGIRATYIPEGKDTIEKVFDEERFKEEDPTLYNFYLKDVVKKGRADSVRVQKQKK